MSKMFLRVFASILLAGLSGSACAQAYTENFDDITTLAGNGWVMTNASVAVGSTGWFQGNPVSGSGPFDAYNGAANSYIAANYNNTGSVGTISNWLMHPNRTLRNGDVLTFYTRKPSPDTYADRLEVRLSTNGASTNVGSGFGVGDYTTLLLSVNPNLVLGVYPTVWTQYTITISGLAAPTSGRMAFRYFVTNGGLNGTNSDYIGIDNAVYTPYVCPAITVSPSTLPNASWGQAYSQSVSQTGALGAPNFAITAGALPPGVTLAANGTISGTPTALGTFNFTVTVNDASGCSGSRAYSITVLATVPGAPTGVSAVAGDAQADVSWVAPTSDGGDSITGYTVTCTDGTNNFNASGTVPPVTLTSLANGTAYTCTVAAINGVGTGPASSPSNSFTPMPPEADLWIEKTAIGSTKVRFGDSVTYSILVGNDGPADAFNVEVLDVLPQRLDAATATWQCVEAVGTGCPAPSSGTGGFDVSIASLPKNATVRFELVGQVIPAIDPANDYTTFYNTATVALPQGLDWTDPTANNQSSVGVRVMDIFADDFEGPSP